MFTVDPVHRHPGPEQPHFKPEAQEASPDEHQREEVQIHPPDLRGGHGPQQGSSSGLTVIRTLPVFMP